MIRHGSTEDKLRQLHADNEAIKCIGLFQTLINECALRSRWHTQNAGKLGADRDMNREHGKADAYAEMTLLLPEIVDALDVLYRKQMEMEEVEDGSTDVDGAGGEADPETNPAPHKDRKRLFSTALHD